MTDEERVAEEKWLTLGLILSCILRDSLGYEVLIEDVPVSAALRTRFEAWSEWAWDYDDCMPKEKRAPFDLVGFTNEGWEIARAIKTELPDWTIFYWDEYKWQHMAELGLKRWECEFEIVLP